MLVASDFGPHKGPDRPVEAFGLTFRSDLGNSAGLDKDGSLLPFNFRLGAGFCVVGTVLSRPHTGNLEVPSPSPFGDGKKHNPWVPLPDSGAALNSLGLPSKGVDEAVENISAFREMYRIPLGGGKARFPIGVSIMGHPLDQGEAKLAGVVDCVRKALPVADFIEINESCPNVKHHKGGDAELTARVKAVMKMRDAELKATGRKVPILVKLGDFGNVEHTVRLMEKLGVDGLIGLNTQKDYDDYRPQLSDTDSKIFEYYTGKHGGGMSGPLIQNKAEKQINAAADFIKNNPKIKLKLVHVGGIATPEDMAKSRQAGGDAVVLREWYTGLMHAVATKPTEQVYGDM